MVSRVSWTFANWLGRLFPTLTAGGSSMRFLVFMLLLAGIAHAADIVVPPSTVSTTVAHTTPDRIFVGATVVTAPSGYLDLASGRKVTFDAGLRIEVGGRLRVNMNPLPPTITPIVDQSILEDTATSAVSFIVGGGVMQNGDDIPAAALTMTATSTDTALVPIVNVVFSGAGANRTVIITPVANLSGSSTITVIVSDQTQTASRSFVVTVRPVNDLPSFIKGANQSGNEDSVAQSVSNWATAINAGPGESAQAINFQVTAQTPTLFTVLPAISSTGTLTYTPAPNAFGSSTVNVAVVDNGGRADGGLDTSATQAFTITLVAQPDIPTLTMMNILTGAKVDTPFIISYAMLTAAGDEVDPDGTAIQFRIESVKSFTLGIRPAGTTGSTSPVVVGTLMDATKELVWRPRDGYWGTTNAFSVRAFDGVALSIGTVDVRVQVDLPTATKTCAYHYDAAGNRLDSRVDGVVTTNTYDKLNRLLTSQVVGSTVTTHSYDLNGNLIGRVKDGVQLVTLGWDGINRLISITSNGVLETNAYDYRTRRVTRKKTVSGVTATTRFRYDGGDCYSERDVTDATKDATFIRSGGMGGGIGSIVYSLSNAVIETFHYNPAVGHVVGTTSASRAMLSAKQYSAFGGMVGSAGASTNNRLANTKERESVGTVEFDNHGFRYYDPAIGRYISRDPLGYDAGYLNVYLYTGNNPVNKYDPLGLWDKKNDGTAKAEKGDSVWGLWKDLGGSKGTGLGWNDFETKVQGLNKGVNLSKLKEGQSIRFEAEKAATGEGVKDDDDNATAGGPEGANSERAIGVGAGVAVAAGNAIDAARGRELYNDLVSKLDPTDAQGRAKVKEFVRSLKPHEVNDAIKALRPSTGAKAGSVASANKSNAAVNALFKRMGIMGKTLGPAGIAVTAAGVVVADDKPRALAEAGMGGLGAWAGFKLGALGGTAVAPGVGTAIGGVGGAIAGGLLGSQAGGDGYDMVNGR